MSRRRLRPASFVVMKRLNSGDPPMLYVPYRNLPSSWVSCGPLLAVCPREMVLVWVGAILEVTRTLETALPGAPLGANTVRENCDWYDGPVRRRVRCCVR